MDRKIKCAIVGLGRIGSIFESDQKREKPASHAGCIDAHPECVIAGGCDIDVRKCADFRIRWECDFVFTNYIEMLEFVSPDIIHIATPPNTHCRFLTEAVDRKIPVIICEKPLAHDLSDAEKMVNYIKGKGSKVLINHERRYANDYNHVKKIIDSGLYGRLVSISAKVYMGQKRKAGSMLLDDGTHMIDILHFLTETYLKIKNVLGDPDSRKFPLLILGTLGNVPIFLECGPGRDHIVFEVDLSFKTGRIVIGNGYYQEYVSIVSPYYEKMRSLQKKDICFNKTGYFENMFKDAVSLFTGKTKTPRSSIEHGYNAMSVINYITNICIRRPEEGPEQQSR